MHHPPTRRRRAASLVTLLVLLLVGGPAPGQDIQRGSGPGAAPPPPPNIRSRPVRRATTIRRTGKRTGTVTVEPVVPPAQATVHYDRGNQLFEENKIDQAIAEYDEAIKLHSKFADAWLMLGNAYFDRANLDEAVRAWQRALLLDDSIYQAHQNLANLSYARQDYEAAAKEYELVVRLRPNYADAHTGLGNSLMQLRRFQEAVTHFERAIAAKGGQYPEVRLHIAYALMRLNDLPKAEESVRKAIAEIGPDSAESAVMWNALGLILYEKSDYLGASAAFAKMVELCGGCPKETLSQAYYNQSLALEQLGKPAEAANALDEYLRLAPYVTNKQDVQKRIERLRGQS